MFGDCYPDDPPAIFILDDSISKTDQQRNILNYEDWKPTTTILQII